MDLISVIVPVYKVEEYLEECVQSLIDQTYKNLEIILVDDGSPDKCPQMCDNWAKKDTRIRVIHKKNGGLSSARNTGIEEAKGEYISFVDSDDFFDEKMYEKLYEGITRSDNIGISGIKFYKFQDGEVGIYNPNWDTQKDELIKAEEFGVKALKQEICFAATNKLYRRDLFTKVRFREGRLNEDTLFVFDLAKEVEKLKCDMWDLDYYAYYYRMRDNSICHSDRPITLSYLENLDIMLTETTNDKYIKVIKLMKKRTVYSFYISLLSDKHIMNRRHYLDLFKEQINSVSYGDFKIKTFRGWMGFVLAKYAPRLYEFIFSIKRGLHKK